MRRIKRGASFFGVVEVAGHYVETRMLEVEVEVCTEHRMIAYLDEVVVGLRGILSEAYAVGRRITTASIPI